MTNKNIRVLLVDDDENQQILLQGQLDLIDETHYSLDWAPTYEKGIELLKTQKYDACLVDYRLGYKNGLEFLHEAKQSGFQTPLIILTGMGQRQIDLEAMRAGAADYLLKDKADAETLERSIRYAIERKSLEGMLVQAAKLSAMGELAAGLAHELNNPIGVIVCSAAALIDAKPKNSELLEMLQRIDRSGARCRDLVRELLDFSRKDEMIPSRFGLAEAVESALTLVQTQARVQIVAVEREIASEGLEILGHKNHIEQIVLNLCNNALYAMPRGGRLNVNLARVRRKRGDCAELRISDTGPGISAEVLEHLFEPFFTTKPVGEGTGLGLSIVQKLVSQHGGEVEVSSVEKKGTTFTVTLPLAP